MLSNVTSVQATQQRHLSAALYSDNVIGSSITAPVPKSAQPSGNGIIDPQLTGSNLSPNNIGLIFFGVGSNTNTATARITGWKQISSLWIPIPLLALSLTFGTQVGVAGTDILNTQNFVSTITASTAFTSANEIISPADGTIALVKFDAFGCRLIQVDLAIGNCTSLNAAAFGF
jgi:hypothetical protein